MNLKKSDAVLIFLMAYFIFAGVVLSVRYLKNNFFNSYSTVLIIVAIVFTTWLIMLYNYFKHNEKNKEF